MENRKHFSVFWMLTYERIGANEIQKSLQLSASVFRKVIRDLEKIKLLSLDHDGNIRVPDFELVKWTGNGPLLRWIKEDWSKQILKDVIKEKLDSESEHFSLRYYQLTPESFRELLDSIRAIDSEFARRSLREMNLGREPRKKIRMVSAVSTGSYVKI